MLMLPSPFCIIYILSMTFLVKQGFSPGGSDPMDVDAFWGKEKEEEKENEEALEKRKKRHVRFKRKIF